MLKTLKLKNVKCFNEAEFDFSNLTVFCGANSAGKSTAIQCLLLLKQTFDENKFSNNALSLTGKFFSVGHVEDFKSHTTSGDKLTISINGCDFSSKLDELIMEDYTLKLESLDLTSDFFTKPFHYLSAYRLAPQNSYDVNYDTSKINFGIYGEYAISELARLGNEPALNQKLAASILEINYKDNGQLKTSEIKLLNAVKETMKILSPDFDIMVEPYVKFDKVTSTYSSSGTANSVRPVNTGFGISNVLPIIIAALSTPENGILIVENPEVHLHPAAQSMLAGFLAITAFSGVQVILETHSDHIINGIRVYAKENKAPEGSIVINSITRNINDRSIKKITIDSSGDFSDIEEGFFDQTEKDLMRLF